MKGKKPRNWVDLGRSVHGHAIYVHRDTGKFGVEWGDPDSSGEARMVGFPSLAEAQAWVAAQAGPRYNVVVLHTRDQSFTQHARAYYDTSQGIWRDDTTGVPLYKHGKVVDADRYPDVIKRIEELRTGIQENRRQQMDLESQWTKLVLWLDELKP